MTPIAAHDGIDPRAPLPFEEILAPLVAGSLRALAEDRAAPWFARLGAEARFALARSLLLGLVDLCAPALLAAFDKRRPIGISLLARLLDGEARVSESDPERTLYAAFVAEMTGGGFSAFLDDYPVLARFVATVRRNFHARLAEFGARLEADLPLIASTFGWASPPGRIIALEASLSDPHRDGRTVMLLRFESGAALVYKPRDVAMEAALQSLRCLCDDQAPRFIILARDGYGWAEAIEAALPETAEAWRRLSAACGRLLALLYLLGATDCHFENLMIRGDEILLVDAETALQPALPGAPSEDACFGDPWLWDSALRPGLLPTWSFGPGGKGACDIGALGRRDSIRGAFMMPRWRAINTDSMTFGTEPIRPAETPPLDIDPEALVRGFSDMYRHLMSEREALAASPAFRALEAMRPRFIVRDTFLYASLLRTAVAPEYLASEDAQRIHLESLPDLPGNIASPWRAIRAAELAALERCDIPYFITGAVDDRLTACDGSTVSVPQLRPAFPDMLQRLAHLSEADEARQVALIRASFTAARVEALPAGASLPWPAAPLPATPDFLPVALQLADGLVAGALPGAGGALHWLELNPAGIANCYLPRRAGWSLYAGNAGIALFLAAAARFGDRPDLREAALAALAPLRAAGRPGREARLVGSGIGQGMGSILYGLTRCAGFLGDEALLADALRLADGMDDDMFARERAAEILSGTAGAIVALLALHSATGQAGLVDEAVVAGRRLLERWEVPPRLTGASHGAAGFALAFARLGAASGDAAFTQAGRDALAFERQVFDRDAGGWPDFRFPASAGKPPCSTMWCHGAPGIGLVRLALAGFDDETRSEIDTALAATLAYGLQPADGLCCGNFGRIDFLVEASRVLDRPDLHDRAAAAAEARLDMWRASGSFLLDGNDAPAWLKPSLFTGIAGIGYTLLRLCDPAAAPTVLTWN